MPRAAEPCLRLRRRAGGDSPRRAQPRRMKRDWYVFRVKPRTEKKTVRWLEHFSIFHYLPTYVKVTRIQRRKVRRELPLFPGYVFVRANPGERLEMLKTNLVTSTILVKTPRIMIHQLRQVRAALRGERPVKVVHSFQPGDIVKIKTGPMRGVEGVVKYEGASATLCLSVDILGATVEVSVSPLELEKLG